MREDFLSFSFSLFSFDFFLFSSGNSACSDDKFIISLRSRIEEVKNGCIRYII